MSSLRREAETRDLVFIEDLGKLDKMRKLGPHHTTAPKQVVEHIVTELRQGNISQAFRFTCNPPWRQGTHASTTDWSVRMAWDKATVIEGTPSGTRILTKSARRTNPRVLGIRRSLSRWARLSRASA